MKIAYVSALSVSCRIILQWVFGVLYIWLNLCLYICKYNISQQSPHIVSALTFVVVISTCLSADDLVNLSRTLLQTQLLKVNTSGTWV